MCIILSKAQVSEILYLKRKIALHAKIVIVICDLRSGPKPHLPSPHVTFHETKHRHIAKMLILYHENAMN